MGGRGRAVVEMFVRLGRNTEEIGGCLVRWQTVDQSLEPVEDSGGALQVWQRRVPLITVGEHAGHGQLCLSVADRRCRNSLQ